MAGRHKKKDAAQTAQLEGLAKPYGLAVPVDPKASASSAPVAATLAQVRCPCCGRKISRFWKWWDTFQAWYGDRYRLIRCRRCGTRFVAERKKNR